MTGAMPIWTFAVAPLGALALLLFGVAIRSGRWGVWLAGYAVLVLALAFALVSNHGRSSQTDTEPHPSAAINHPNGSGYSIGWTGGSASVR